MTAGRSSARVAQKVTVYTPESPLRHPMAMVRHMFADLRLSGDLAWRLAVRDISAQYRQTSLGLAWAFLSPVMSTIVWMFLNSTGVVAISTTDLPYPVYVFAGTMLWQVFGEALQMPNQQVNAAKPMLSKVNFPKEAIILSGVIQVLFNAIIRVVLLVIALLIYGIAPAWTLLLVPVGVLSLVLAGTAMGLLLAPVGALYQDVSRGMSVLVQFWMYVTPVVFPLPESGWTATLIRLNPLTPLIMTGRSWLAGIPSGLLPQFAWISGAMLAVLLLAWILYWVSMPILIERMNA